MLKRRKDNCNGVPIPKTFGEATPNVIGRRGEKNLKRVTGCKLTPGSGCGNIKGDGILGTKMMEKKSTVGKSMVVKREALEKAQKQAWQQNQEPVFVIEFETMELAPPQWGMVPLERLMELFEIEEQSKKL